MMHPVLTSSASSLARMIRTRELTSRQIVELHIAHIRQVNPVLNAVVKERFDEARAEADRADELLRSLPEEDLPPFHGVPCSIKESFALTGMPNSAGLVARRDKVATSDAVAVERLRRAGAIPLGVTNVSELCMWMESSNRVYGRTNNPYDPARIVGGSSGGEGAIIGAGGTPFGLGSDVGGSIRMPAFFNGVFGHKPTGGLVPGTGQWPNASPGLARYLTTGPLTRRAEDLMPLLRVLAGPDGEDPGCEPFELGDPEQVSLEGLTVLDVRSNGFVGVSRELQQAQARVAKHLASRGARVTTAHIRGLERSLDIWSSMLAEAEGPSFAELLGEGQAVNATGELLRWTLGRSPHTLPAIGLALAERFVKASPRRLKRAIEAGRALRNEIVNRLGPHGVMLYPSYSTPAPRHHAPLFPPIRWVYTAILNVLELPVTQVPLGLDARGLPLGVQVASIHGHDHMTIAVALELERAFGGWQPPKFEALVA